MLSPVHQTIGRQYLLASTHLNPSGLKLRRRRVFLVNEMDGVTPLTATDVPIYPDIPTYANVLGGLHIYEGDGWKTESMSYKTSAYIASNLSGTPAITFRGPDAQEALSRMSMNNVYNWPVGTSKHLVQPDDNGYIANHGLVVRDGEDTFRQLAAGSWPLFKALSFGLDVDVSLSEVFIFQIAGPASIQILERLVGEDLRAVEFLASRRVTIPGLSPETEVELSRIGMAGTLAYELRGPLEHGPEVFDAVYRAGQDFDIKRSGWRTYYVNHTEGGFPQMLGSFLPSSIADAEYQEHPSFPPFLRSFATDPSTLSGSIDSADLSARFRTPSEVNWGWMAKFDHDFIGRAAVEAEAANRRRKTVTLRWNTEDILDVFASQFQQGEEYKNFEFPITPQKLVPGGHADLVTKDGKPIGVSSVVAYSYYYRQTISQSTIDLDESAIGNEVIVHWGDSGGRIKQIRATVQRFPYLDLPSNKDYDLSSIPSGVAGR